MTAAAQTNRFAEIGASVRAGDKDHLIVCAGAQQAPAALVWQLREAKAQVLAALASDLKPQAVDADDSHPTSRQQHFINRTIHWESSGSKSVNSVGAVDALRLARIGGGNVGIVGDDPLLE